MKYNRSLSLQDLDRKDWGDPNPEDTNLVKTCHRLRRKPVQDFTAENLRIMLGQNVGTEYLAPVVIERLEQNPMLEGNFYPGDVLHCLISDPPLAFWSENLDLTARLVHVLGQYSSVVSNLDSDEQDFQIEKFRDVSNKIEAIKALADQRLERTQ